jgi:hypothetical protein
MVVNQRGLGLVECLAPLTLTAFIEKSMEKKADLGLDARKTQLEANLNEINRLEKMYALQFSNGEIKKDTWLNVTSDYNDERTKLRSELKDVESKMEELIPIDLPRELITDLSSLTPEMLRPLFLKTFKRITVFPDRITVELLNGGKFDIERIRLRNTRLLPFFIKAWNSKKNAAKLFPKTDNQSDSENNDEPMNPSHTVITSDTRIDVVYIYKSAYRPFTMKDLDLLPVYADENIWVFKKGHNETGKCLCGPHLRPHTR